MFLPCTPMCVCLFSLSHVCCPESLSAPQWNKEMGTVSPPRGLLREGRQHRLKCWPVVSQNLQYLLLFFPLLCQGIVKRDEIVFRAARRRGIPILMVTSGGYQKKTARIIADSILNLNQQGLIGEEALEEEEEGSSSLVTSVMCSSGPAGSTFTTVWGAWILGLTLAGVTHATVIFEGT